MPVAKMTAARRSKAQKLRFNNKRKYESHRLPFYGKSDSKGQQYTYWCVPKTGGYGGGNQTGQSLARIYLQHLKSQEHSMGGTLQHIVFDMLEVSNDESDEGVSLRGQVVGFFLELERWLEASAKRLDDGRLGVQPPNDLLKLANDGLNGDDESLETLVEQRQHQR